MKVFIVMGKSIFTKERIVIEVFDSEDNALLLKDQLNRELNNKYWIEKHDLKSKATPLYSDNEQQAELGQSFIP